MKNEFIPYEQALALKELGFDEPHFGLYGKSEAILYKVIGDKFDVVDDIHFIKAPLYQQAFKWFREKYNIVGIVKNLNTRTTNHKFYAEIVEPVTVSSYSIYDTYEQAELECLKKLIEIVKNEKNIYDIS